MINSNLSKCQVKRKKSASVDTFNAQRPGALTRITMMATCPQQFHRKK
jgi:hypothetical protein